MPASRRVLDAIARQLPQGTHAFAIDVPDAPVPQISRLSPQSETIGVVFQIHKVARTARRLHIDKT